MKRCSPCRCPGSPAGVFYLEHRDRKIRFIAFCFFELIYFEEELPKFVWTLYRHYLAIEMEIEMIIRFDYWKALGRWIEVSRVGKRQIHTVMPRVWKPTG